MEELKEELKEQVDIYKDPTAVEKGKRGGLKALENRRRLVEEVEGLRIGTRRFDEEVKSLRFDYYLQMYVK